MIQSVIDAIVKAIKDEYQDYRVYTESVEQGLITPCFSVLCLSADDEHRLGVRYNKDYLININYFPSSDEPYMECQNVGEVLGDILQDIVVDGAVIHGSNMSWNITDSVLVATVSYRIYAKKDTVTEIDMAEQSVLTTAE